MRVTSFPVPRNPRELKEFLTRVRPFEPLIAALQPLTTILTPRLQPDNAEWDQDDRDVFQRVKAKFFAYQHRPDAAGGTAWRPSPFYMMYGLPNLTRRLPLPRRVGVLQPVGAMLDTSTLRHGPWTGQRNEGGSPAAGRTPGARGSGNEGSKT